jgi:glutamyl-tRNA synthetase
MALIPSRNRDASIEDNLRRFDEMITGSEEGSKWFLRAKIDYTSPNGALRDPAIYRCINKPHHVTGDKYKAYPMYDLACPIVDSLDGVTHALRANEYADRKPQYEWFLQALGMPHIEIFDFRWVSVRRCVEQDALILKVLPSQPSRLCVHPAFEEEAQVPC